MYIEIFEPSIGILLSLLILAKVEWRCAGERVELRVLECLNHAF